jgi:hypothetical protein
MRGGAGNLLESDPQKERDRLNELADRLDAVARHLTALENAIGASSEEILATYSRPQLRAGSRTFEVDPSWLLRVDQVSGAGATLRA